MNCFEWVQFIADLVLTIATCVAAVYTALMAKSTSKSAKEQVEYYRKSLKPALQAVMVANDEEVAVYLENRGPGPAIVSGFEWQVEGDDLCETVRRYEGNSRLRPLLIEFGALSQTTLDAASFAPLTASSENPRFVNAGSSVELFAVKGRRSALVCRSEIQACADLEKVALWIRYSDLYGFPDDGTEGKNARTMRVTQLFQL